MSLGSVSLLLLNLSTAEEPVLLVDRVEVVGKTSAMLLSFSVRSSRVATFEDVNKERMRVRAHGVLGKGLAAALLDLRDLVERLLGEKSFDVIPGRLVVGRLGNPEKGSVDLLLQCGELRSVDKDVVALVPSGIVAVVLVQQEVNVCEFVLPKVVGLDDPLTVGPSVVVLGVRLDQTRGKFDFTRVVASVLHEPLAMVPDLVVLRVFSRHVISELEVVCEECSIVQSLQNRSIIKIELQR